MIRPLYRFVALCLLLAWGPATMCCALEAAGWDVMCSNPACHDSGAGKTAQDGCNVIESGSYNSVVPHVKVMPPAPMVCACLICIRELEPALESAHTVFVSETGRPRDWVPIWQFERRAAAPARAPDSLIA